MQEVITGLSCFCSLSDRIERGTLTIVLTYDLFRCGYVSCCRILAVGEFSSGRWRKLRCDLGCRL